MTCIGKEPVFAQTMLRVKDPKVSIDFYTRLCGLKLINKMDFPTKKFTLYFLAFTDESPPNTLEEENSGIKNATWLFTRKYFTLELTHNWGTETDPEFKGYHNGNSDPRGFGHIGFVVEDIYASSKAFEKEGVKVVRQPGPFEDAGHLAFISDPDGYWIELIQRPKV